MSQSSEAEIHNLSGNNHEILRNRMKKKADKVRRILMRGRIDGCVKHVCTHECSCKTFYKKV